MELQLFGINHKTSVISEREKFIINESNQIILDNHLKKFLRMILNLFLVFQLVTEQRFILLVKGDY